MSRSNLILGRLYRDLLHKMHVMAHTFKIRWPEARTRESGHRQRSAMQELEPRILLSAATELDIDFNLANATKVSLIVEDTATGEMVRELLRGESYDAGSHTVVWDGLDDQGNAVDAGSYTWKLLETGGITADFQFLIGTNPPDDPFVEWVGDQGGVGGVAYDASGNLIIAAAKVENVPRFIRLTADGTQRLGQALDIDDGGDGSVALGAGTLDNASERVFMLQHRSGDARIYRVFNDLRFVENGSSGDLTNNGNRPIDMDVYGNVIGLVYENSGLVQLLDADDYSVITSLTVTNANGITLSGSGTTDNVYVTTTDNRLVSFTQANTTVQTRINGQSLDIPGWMDIDHSNGDIYIWNNGTQQILRYNSSYQLQTMMGTSGGRQLGAYVDTDFSGVVDITADGNGNVWAVEASAPRRMVLINGTTGAVETNAQGKQFEWFGGQNFYTNYAVNNADATDVWGDSTFGSIVQFDVDYTTGTWDIAAVYNDDGPGGNGFGDGLFPNRANGGESSSFWEPRTIGGETFLFYSNFPAILRVDAANGQLLPASVLGVATQNGNGANGYPQPWVDAIVAAGYGTAQNPDTAGAPKHFSWADTNGNGIMEASEFTLYNNVTVNPGQGDGDITPNNDYVTTGISGFAYHEIDRVGYTGPSNNIPTYSWNNVTDGPLAPAEWGAHIGLGVERTPDGQTFVSTWNNNLTAPRWGFERFSHEVVNARLGKFDANGNYEVGLGGTAWGQDVAGTGMFFQNNQILGNTSIPNDSERAVWVNDRVAQGPVLYTTDGLYIGTALDNRVADGLPDGVYQWLRNQPYALQYDMLTGFVHQDSTTGDIYWLGAGANDTPVFKITGFDTLSRQSGSFTVGMVEQEATLTGTGIRAFYYNDATFTDLNGTGTLTHLDMNWDWNPDGGTGPAPNLPSSSGLSQRFVGEIEPEFSETYHFYAEVGGGDFVRVIVDGATVIDTISGDINGGGSGSIFLRAGQQYDIVIESVYYTTVPALNVSWTSTSMDRQILQAPHLYLGPIVDVSLNENAGSLMADASGYGNDLRFFGADRVAGISGNALQFNGTSDLANAGISTMATQNVSLALWAKSDTANWNSTGTLAGVGGALQLKQTAGSKEIAFEVTTVNGTYTAAVTPTMDITQWHHYVGTYDGTTARLFIDGVEVAFVAATGELADNSSRLLIGTNDSIDAFYDGAVDEIRLYDRALSESEVSDQYYVMVDTPLVRTIAVDRTANEAGPETGVIRVLRTGNSTNALTVSYTVTGDVTSGDYEALLGSVTIAAGDLYTDVRVVPVLDGIDNEQPELLYLTPDFSANYTVSHVVGTGGATGITIADADDLDVTHTETFDSDAGDGWEIRGLTDLPSINMGWSAGNEAGGASGGEAFYDFYRNSPWIDAGYTDNTLPTGRPLTLNDPIYASGEIFFKNYRSESSDGRVLAGYLGAGHTGWPDARGIGLVLDDGIFGIGVFHEGLYVPNEIKKYDGLTASTATNTRYSFEYSWDPGSFTLSGTLTPEGGATQNYSVTLTQAEFDQLVGTQYDQFGGYLISQNSEQETPGSGAGFESRLDDVTYGVRRDAAVNSLPVVRVEATDPDANEIGANTGTFTVTRNSTVGTLDVTVAFSGTATFNTNYTATHTATVSFANGQDTATVTITPLTDSIADYDETVVLSIVDSANYVLDSEWDSATATIIDETILPLVTLKVTDSSAGESGANTAQFELVRELDLSGDLTVNYTLGGTASSGDYSEVLSGTIVLPNGQVSTLIDITPVDDSDLEGLENLTLTLTPSNDYTITGNGTGNIFIEDNDEVPGLNWEYFDGSFSSTDQLTGLTPNATGTSLTVSTQPAYDQGDFDGFGLRFYGNLYVPSSGNWTFFTTSDDGSRLYIDGQQVVFNDFDQPPTERSGSINLSAGAHTIEIRFREGGGGEFISASWAGPGVAKQVIPSAAFGTGIALRSTVEVTATDAVASEDAGNPGQFTVTRDTTAGNLTVNYTVSGSASAGDYNEVLTGSVTFLDGESSKIIDITPDDDSVIEASETLTLTLSSNVDYDLGVATEATLTILENEGEQNSFNTDNWVSTNWNFGGEPDWANTNAAGGVGSGEVTATNWTSHGVNMWYADDTLPGGSMTFADSFFGSGRAIIPQSSITGTNNPLRFIGYAQGANYDWDGTGIGLAISANNEIGLAVYSATNFTINVDRFDGVAIAGDLLNSPFDFVYEWDPTTNTLSGSVTPVGGTTTNLSLTLTGAEAAAVASKSLTHFGMIGFQHNINPFSGSVSIGLDDVSYGRVADTVNITATDNTATEQGSTAGVFTVTRNHSAGDLVVNYTVSGSATVGTDFLESLAGTVTILDGQTNAIVTVTAFDDSAYEGPETVTLTLATGSGYNVGTQSSDTVTITDNDLPTINITATDSAAAEAGTDTGTFTVDRGVAANEDLTVNYTIASNASNGEDYTTLSGSVTILAGQSTATITVTPIDDGLDEQDETVTLTLQANSAYIIGTQNSAVVTITDNDTLAGPWQNTEFAQREFSGGAEFSNGVMTIESGGGAIFGNTDYGHFAYQNVTGDVEIVARVTSLEYTANWANAGVMIRETTDEGSKNVFMALTADQGASLQYRDTNDAITHFTNTGPGPITPYWVKLTRTGNVFRGYISADGTNWTQVGSDVTVSMSSNVLIGLAASPNNLLSLGTSTFDNISII